MADTPNLSYAITLSPADAIEYFESKGWAITWNWRDIADAAHAEAFTVAKAADADVLSSIRERLTEALKTGSTQADFSKNLTEELQALGWWGRVEGAQLGSPWRLDTIYRTNLQTAYNAGRYKAQIDNVDARPWWMYVAVLDRRTRPDHAALDGEVFRFDDPFWDTHTPSLGFNCRCRTRAFTDSQLKRKNIKPSKGKGNLKNFGAGRDMVTGYETSPGKYAKPDIGWNQNQSALGLAHTQKIAREKAILNPQPARGQLLDDIDNPPT